MSDTTHSDQQPETPNFAPRLYGIALLVVGITLVGFWLVARFTAIDLARDMQTWNEKLNLIAESRVADVDRYVASHFNDLRTLASNPSLQLYMTELQAIPDTIARPAEAEPAQKAYLRNLLVFTAERSGFGSSGKMETIRANVQEESKSGLAVINNNNQVVVSTPVAASTRDIMLDRAQKLTAGQEGLIDIQKDKNGTIYMGFMVPIFSIQGDRDANSQIGKVVGIKVVDAGFFSLLKHPGTTEKSLETVLVRLNSDAKKIEYISPLQDGSAALAKEKANNSLLAEAGLLQVIGSFSSSVRDYRDKLVLATSRSVAGTPWTLIVKIDRGEALADGNQRRGSMVTFFILIIMAILLIIIAVWRHAHSKRAMMMSRYFRKMAAQAKAQEELLRLVADNQPEAIYIVDAEQNYQFANKQSAESAKTDPEFMVGKSLSDIRGAARAESIASQCKRALTLRQIVYDVEHIEEGKGAKVIQSAYVPLDAIPIASLPANTPGVLVVEQDISEVVQEREQRLSTQYQLVQTLIKLVDRRDPFAANHSQLVSQLAQAVASDMQLDAVTAETARLAGSLMNIGKIIVPPTLLTKTDNLTNEEKQVIRESMNASADLLKNIPFDGPVVETLRQWQEKWDGTGPLGLKGDAILMSARIIATCNAFIGMISPRSWRTAIPIESANKFLLDQADMHFDRRIVVALVNYVENHSGKAWLKKVLDAQKNVA